MTSASKSLDKTEVFRMQYLVVTSTVSGEINNHDAQLQCLISPSDTIFFTSCIAQISSCPLCRTIFKRADCRKLYVDVDAISCSEQITNNVPNDKIKNVLPLPVE